MNLRLQTLLFGTALAVAPTTLQAQCVTVDPTAIPQLRIDPLDAAGPGEVVHPFQMTFRRAGALGPPLVVRYQIVDEDSNVLSRVGLSQGPTIEWEGDGRARNIGSFRSQAYSLLRSDQIVVGAMESTARSNVVLRLTNLREDLAAGVYREQFTVRYWCGEAESSMPYEAPGAISVSVAVPNVLSASVAGASARGEIDFNDFQIRARSLRVSVRSTGPFEVSARSLNGGQMLREAARTVGAADRIRYEATFDGLPITMDGGARRQVSRAGLLGRQVPLEISVEDVADKRAGAYSDTLFLTLTPAN